MRHHITLLGLMLLSSWATSSVMAVNRQLRSEELATPASGHSTTHVVCNITGVCLPCSEEEKADNSNPACRTSTYRQPISCLVLPPSSQDKAEPKPDERLQSQRRLRRLLADPDQGAAAGELVPAGDLDLDLDGQVVQEAMAKAADSKANQTMGSQSTGKPPETRSLRQQKAYAKQVAWGNKIASLLPTPWRRRLFFDAARGEANNRRFETFQSCTPPDAPPDSASAMAFQGLMLLLLFISAPVVYLRRKNQFSRR